MSFAEQHAELLKQGDQRAERYIAEVPEEYRPVMTAFAHLGHDMAQRGGELTRAILALNSHDPLYLEIGVCGERVLTLLSDPIGDIEEVMAYLHRRTAGKARGKGKG